MTGRGREALVAGLVVAAALAWSPIAIAADRPVADWSPAASERLERLPVGALDRAIDRDFRESGLSSALTDADADLAARRSLLAELHAAIDAAPDGRTRDDLRHRFLEEKHAFLQSMGRRHDLERQRLRTRLTLVRRLIGRIDGGAAAADPATADLVRRRDRMAARFESAASKVDMTVFADGLGSESRYGSEYRRHAMAIDALARAINAHPLNTAPETDGRGQDRRGFLRHLAQEAETGLALLDQQDQVLAYMAKLLALDAMAQADAEAEAAAPEGSGGADLSGAVGLFIDRY